MAKNNYSMGDLLNDVKTELNQNLDICKLTGMTPQPKQLEALKICGLDGAFYGRAIKPPLASNVGFGGAAGGGKSQTIQFIALTLALHIPGCSIGIFRRSLKQLEGSEGLIPELRKLCASSGIKCKYNASKFQMLFNNGSRIHFCYVSSMADATNYQGHAFYAILWDEITQNFWDEVQYIKTRNRSTTILPGYDRAYPFLFACTNPGNVGNGWYKQVFQPSQKSKVRKVMSPSATEIETVFIQSKLSDNQILMDKDPGYLENLNALNPVLRDMLLNGSFDVGSGLYFAEYFKQHHVVDKADMKISPHWHFYGSIDYGFYSKSFNEHSFIYLLYGIDENGVVYIIDEIGLSGATVEKQVEKILELQTQYSIKPIFNVGCRGMTIQKQLGQPTIAEQYMHAGVPTLRTNVTSVADAEMLIIQYLQKDKLRISTNCIDLIEQLSNAPVDTRKPEQTDPNFADHSIEALYDALSARGSTADIQIKPKPVGITGEMILDMTRIRRYR